MSYVKDNFLKSFRNYRFQSIFFKNFILVLLTILLPCVCALMICYYMYDRISWSERRAYSDEMITRVSRDVDNLFIGLKEKMVMLAFDNDMELFFIRRNGQEKIFYDQQEIYRSISLYNMAIDELEAVYLYAPFSQSVISTKGLFEYDEFYDRECLDQWVGIEKNFWIEYLNREVSGKQKENICLYYITYHSAECRGVTIFQVNMKEFAEKMNYGEQVRVLIANNHQVIYDSGNEYTGRSPEELEALEQSDEEIVVSSGLAESHLTVTLHINSDVVSEKLDHIKFIMIILISIMLLTTLLLVFNISQKIFAPFHEIMDALKDDVPQISEKKLLESENEVSYIKNSIYAARSRTYDVEEKLRVRIDLLRKAQAVALQAQINSHFINNALENMNWKIVRSMGKGNEVTMMMNALSTLLRTTLENTDTFVTLKEEMEYVQKYIFLQRKLLSDQFDVEIKIPEELEQCNFIKLLLQPVVENAIKYGIKPYGGKGMLKITAMKAENELHILVKDSGLGLDRAEVEQINDSIRQHVIEDSKHIGLSNVNQRIILAFGDDYGVNLSSEIGVGTTVMLRIPFQIKEEQEIAVS